MSDMDVLNLHIKQEEGVKIHEFYCREWTIQHVSLEADLITNRANTHTTTAIFFSQSINGSLRLLKYSLDDFKFLIIKIYIELLKKIIKMLQKVMKCL